MTKGVLNGAPINALAIAASGRRVVSLAGRAIVTSSTSVSLGRRARVISRIDTRLVAGGLLRGRRAVSGAADILIASRSDGHARKAMRGRAELDLPIATARLLRRTMLRGSSSMIPLGALSLEYEFLHMAAASRRLPPAREFRTRSLPLERRCLVVPAAGGMHHPSERVRS